MRFGVAAAQAGIVAATLALWQIGAVTGLFGSDAVSPVAVGGRIATMFASGMIWPHLADTLAATVTALLLSAVLGTALGIALARSAMLEAVLDPILVAVQGIPRVAFGPLILLFLGVGTAAKVVLAVSIALFVFSANALEGMRQVEPALLRQMSLMGASRRQTLTMVIGPSLVPWLWSALDLALGLSLIGVIIAEFLSSTRGLGHLISAASMGFDTTGVVALLVVTMLAVTILRAGLTLLRNRYLPWAQRP